MHSHLKVKCALYDDFKKFLHHQTTLQPVSEASITAAWVYTQALFKYNPIQTTQHAATSPLLA